MNNIERFSFATVLSLLLIAVKSNEAIAAERYSIDEAKIKVIQEYITKLNVNCPCPYSKKPTGESCQTSAYSKKTDKVICFKSDVSEAMVIDWSKRNGVEKQNLQANKSNTTTNKDSNGSSPSPVDQGLTAKIIEERWSSSIGIRDYRSAFLSC